MTNLKLLLGVVCEYSSQKDPEGLKLEQESFKSKYQEEIVRHVI